MTSKAHEAITARILEALEAGTVPWRKPWHLPAGAYPQSVAGHRYNGINALLLGLTEYSDTRWLTFNKARELGGTVRKGEKGMPLVFWKQHMVEETKNGETKMKAIPILRYFTVFNVEQCDGLTIKPQDTAEPTPPDPIPAAEAMVVGMPNPPKMANDGGDRAYYQPTIDSLHMPPRNAFKDTGEYYATLFHEMGHSTGHPKRLNRGLSEKVTPFGSEDYSKEELVAEFTAAFLTHQVGIQNTLDNSAAYVANWARVIRNDVTLVLAAASLGQKAADHILGRAKLEHFRSVD